MTGSRSARSSTKTCSSLSCAADGSTTGLTLRRSAVSRIVFAALGQPPRTADEMAEHLRLVGDLTLAEVSGPMNALLIELREMDRAVTIELAGVVEPLRWILAEEVPLFHTAFLAGDGTAGEAIDDARETIVRRFLRTRALIGLAELTARYPISSAEATELLDRWAEEGKVVRMVESGSNRETRWAERENLNEMQKNDRGGPPSREPGGYSGSLRGFPVAPATRSSVDTRRRAGIRRGRPGPTAGVRGYGGGLGKRDPAKPDQGLPSRLGSTMFSDERAGSGEPRRGRGTSRKSRFSVVIFSASSAATANQHRSRLRKRR